MSFGSTISVAVLVLAALIMMPKGIQVEHYNNCRYIACRCLASGDFGYSSPLLYRLPGRGVGSNPGNRLSGGAGIRLELERESKSIAEARFSLTYTIVTLLGAVLVATGIDPLKLTIFSMALTAATLPVSIVPFCF